MPVNTLKKVVFPAPLGPMIEAIRPSSSSKSTVFSAVNPPKRLVTPLASRITAIRRCPSTVPPARQFPVAAPGGKEALRAEDHHEDQDQPEDHALVLRGLELRRQVGEVEAQDRQAGIAQLVDPERESLEHLEVEHGDHRGAEDRARDGTHPAEDDHG